MNVHKTLVALVLALVVVFMAIGPPATAEINTQGSIATKAPPTYTAGTMDMMEVPAVAWRSPCADRTVIRSAAIGSAITNSITWTITATASGLANKGLELTTAPATSAATTAMTMPPSTVPGGHRKVVIAGGKDEGPHHPDRTTTMASAAGHRPILA
ncbi:MAG: hypothetical protein HYU35_01445 [Parcubacteria group bacterium]|nr:hypothetical protein [Parcubacteria group bacterium]